MQDKSSYLLAADSEAEMEEWVTVLNKILQLNFEAAMQEKRNGDSHEGRKVPERWGRCEPFPRSLSAKALFMLDFTALKPGMALQIIPARGEQRQEAQVLRWPSQLSRGLLANCRVSPCLKKPKQTKGISTLMMFDHEQPWCGQVGLDVSLKNITF